MTAIRPLLSSTTRPQARPRTLLAERDSSIRRQGTEVVHLTAECWPFARTGGLGEAVSALARHQNEAGTRAIVLMPFYDVVRQRAPRLVPAGPDFEVSLGGRVSTARLWQLPRSADHSFVMFVEHPTFRGRAGIYGEAGRDYPDNAERFAWFTVAALTALPSVPPAVRIVHSHDWHAALAPVYLRTRFAGSAFHGRLASVQAVHNAAFQGHVGRDAMARLDLGEELYDWRLLEWYGGVNLLKGGIVMADAVTTVSATHARELCTQAGGFGLHDAFSALGERLVGIVNGIDQEVWDPTSDPLLPAQYSADRLAGKRRSKAALQATLGLAESPATPLVAMCARLTEQKGLDLVLGSALLSRDDVQFVFLGEGEQRFADALHARAAAAPGRVAAVTTFRDDAEHLLMAGADIVLLPSRFEPCGLAQMRAQRYGAIPVAHRVGGLADTIEDDVTGFLFNEYGSDGLMTALQRALARYRDQPAWRRMMLAAMLRDFGVGRAAIEHQEVYRRALACAAQRAPLAQ